MQRMQFQCPIQAAACRRASLLSRSSPGLTPYSVWMVLRPPPACPVLVCRAGASIPPRALCHQQVLAGASQPGRTLSCCPALACRAALPSCVGSGSPGWGKRSPQPSGQCSLLGAGRTSLHLGRARPPWPPGLHQRAVGLRVTLPPSAAWTGPSSPTRASGPPRLPSSLAGVV